VIVPDCIPSKFGKALKLIRRGGREAELVPQFAEEFGSDKKRAALKSEVARKNSPRGGFELGEESVPIFTNTVRGKDQIVAQYPDGDLGIVKLETERGSPRWKRGSCGRERHIHRLMKVDATVGGTTIVVQRDNKNTTIRERDTNAKVIRVGTSDVHPPRET
jgi:hypothetical protein